MTYTQINNRLHQLINAYAWSKCNDKVKLSTGERICISQERAALMQVADGFASEPRYQLPEHLDRKIQQITSIINSTNWERPIYVPEPY